MINIRGWAAAVASLAAVRARWDGRGATLGWDGDAPVIRRRSRGHSTARDRKQAKRRGEGRAERKLPVMQRCSEWKGRHPYRDRG